MEDGERTSSNFNEPFNFEVKQEKMENEENKNTEQPESFPKFGDSNLSAGGEKVDEEAEKLPAEAEGGEESRTDKNDVAGLGLEVEVKEELDKGARGESVFQGVGIAEEAVAEYTQVSESEVGGNRSGRDSGDPLLAAKGEEEMVSAVAGDGSESGSGIWDLRTHVELEMNVTSEVPVGEEIEVSDPKALTDTEDRGYGRHIEKEEGGDIEPERIPIQENDSETVIETGICGDEVTDNLYASEVAVTEKLVGNIEENCDSKTQIEVMNFSEGEHVHDSDGGMGSLNTDVKGESDADGIVSRESLMEDKKDMSMEVGEGMELNELSTAVDMKEVEAGSGEGILAEDTKMEAQACMEVEEMTDYTVPVVDFQTDTEVVERNDVSKAIPPNDTERETDETKNDVEALDDSWAATEENETMATEDAERKTDETKNDVEALDDSWAATEENETMATEDAERETDETKNDVEALDDSRAATEVNEAMTMEDAERETDETNNNVEEPRLTLDDSQFATEEDEAMAMVDAERETDETNIDVEEPGSTLDDSQAATEEDEAMAMEGAETRDTEVDTETDVAEPVQLSGEKRKRESNTKGSSSYRATAKTPGRKKAGEDVCFICFDGGDLVLCDRRGCPKAYHPSCVNRDEAFFNTKGRWNCGWHMCSICEKNAHYMCYTCTYSSCKGCIKDEAVIFCVRGNKGFCETCMRTVTLIENNQPENAQLEFDDKTSWESLFKDYYLDLKSKLSLSSVEIAEAKHPWKGSKQESPEAGDDADYDGGSRSDDSIESQKTSKSKRRKLKKRSKSSTKEEASLSVPVSAGNGNISSEDSEWATKELLEFVSHMRNGDVSELSQFDVQALLLEYIKQNKLRDPRRKSQIICDFRLGNLFGKPRVGHFEMLKLLESHFPVKKDKADEVQGSGVGTESNQLDVGGDVDTLARGVKGRKSKTRKKGERRDPQSNLEDYAAIDTHNIGLIYLRRKLMEDLLEDVQRFHDKVVGAFVRIRISGSNQKQDLYRLVQVVGTSKAAEPYKIGKKSCDTMLEILNLDKAEIISIDTISNQDFTEEECKRLRQSIKCGLINRLTVGDILDKTMELQAARVNDWLESEVMRLSHLRDRASDLGRRKELRECVEKLQLLKTPEERHRRLEEIPEVHADPKMDPSYESDEDESEADDSRRDSFTRSRGSSFNRRGRDLASPRGDYNTKDTWNGSENASSKNWESTRNLPSKSMYTDAARHGEMVNENSYNHGRDRDVQESKSGERTMNYFSKSESVSIASPITSSVSLAHSVPDAVVKINETEKIWHYKDPSGKVQGPFSMAQLQKWNNTGYFPADMRIWRASLEDDPILLSDALSGKYQPAVDKRFPAVSAMHTSGISSSYPGKIIGSPLHQDMQRPNADQGIRSHVKHSKENWVGNDLTNLPSPTPKQKNAGWMRDDEDLLHGATQYTSSNGLLHSPTPALPDSMTHSSPPTSVLNSAAQSGGAFTLPSGAGSLHMQSNVTGEQHAMQMHGHLPTVAQSAHSVIGMNNPSVEAHGWGSGPQSGQGQAQGWGGTTLDVQNSSGHFSNSGIQAVPQPDLWRPSNQGTLPNMLPPSTQNVSWGMRPENPNTGWGNVQSNPSMGWGTPTPGSTNINVGLAAQPPAPGNTSGWVAPSGHPGNTVQGPAGNVNSGWVATPGWGGAPAPGNGWGPPSGNPGGLAQANPNQGFGAPGGTHGMWGSGQNHNGGQFSGQRERRDPGFGGGGRTSWNSGASRPFNKRGMVCPYNANGRCKKGARCDYLHT